MGVVRFGTMSDGTVLAPFNIFRRLEALLRKAQQAMSRKKKFSNNWKKAKARVQRIHLRIANARRDFLHKASTAISKNHAMVVVEDLQVNNMSRSAKGTVEKPGRNVRAKSGLNKSILDQGWSEFRRQLEYKLTWAGGMVLAVPPMNTSRTCLCCWQGLERQPQDAIGISLHRLRVYEECRPGRGHQHLKGGIRPDSLSSERRSNAVSSRNHPSSQCRLNTGSARRNPLPFRASGGLGRGRGGCQLNLLEPWGE